MNEGSLCSPVDFLLLCVGVLTGDNGSPDPQLVGTLGHPRCYLCHQPIGSRPRSGKWPKVKHHPRCPKRSAAQSGAASAASAAPARSHKCRAASDPGELPAQAASLALTRRVTPPSPVPANKKQRITRQEERIMRQLDETHARRMAAEAVAATAAATAAPAAVAAAAATTADEQGTAHTGFTVAFVP